MKTTNLLVLDDLGRDRSRSSGDSTSFASGQLDLVINHRNQHRLPIIWISNLDERALIGAIGTATYTRLIEDNPSNPYLTLPNLRTHGAKAVSDEPEPIALTPVFIQSDLDDENEFT
jgi:DNA replication protein DnaC